MSSSWEDRPFEPTPRRRQLAREQGQFAISRDLGAAVVLLAGLLAVYEFGGFTLRQNFVHIKACLAVVPDPSATPAEWLQEWCDQMLRVALGVLPILVAPALAAILVNSFQVGLGLRWNAVAPDAGRLNPISGFQRIRWPLAFCAGVGGFVKLVLVSAVAILYVRRHLHDIYAMTVADEARLMLFMMRHLLALLIYVAGGLLAFGLVDYALRRWRHEMQLRMTDDEMREELRSMRIDPQVTARRQIMRQPLDDAP